jgi:hypothetical protein
MHWITLTHLLQVWHTEALKYQEYKKGYSNWKLGLMMETKSIYGIPNVHQLLQLQIELSGAHYSSVYQPGALHSSVYKPGGHYNNVYQPDAYHSSGYQPGIDGVCLSRSRFGWIVPSKTWKFSL